MKRFHLTEHYALINFNASLCDSEIQIVSSKSFEMVLAQYIRDLRKQKDPTILKLKGVRVNTFHDAYKQLLIYDYDDLLKKNPNLSSLLKERNAFYRFTEMFYDSWRKLERFGMILKNRRYPYQSHAQNLITASDNFNQKILFLYRTITQNILGREFLTFRQLPAGINANMVLMPYKFSNLPKYQMLQHVHFIQDMLTRPPFIIYSKSNKREGLF